MKGNYKVDWTSKREKHFRKYLNQLPDDFNFLEIGTFEGRTEFWILENFPKSNNIIVDNFEIIGTGVKVLHDFEDSEKQVNVDDVENRFYDNLKHYSGRQNFVKGYSQDIKTKDGIYE